MIVHLISTMSVVWRKGPREKRRPKSGRTLVTHGRISSPFWFSTIFCKISVFEHTPPLKKINIFDRTHWSRILGFKIGASQGSNWLKTKKSDGPFWRKSWEDFQKIKGSISKKGLIRFFCFSSSQAQKGPNFKALYMVLMGPVESVKIFWGRGGQYRYRYRYDRSLVSVSVSVSIGMVSVWYDEVHFRKNIWPK